jgi:hypothetical protein
MKKARRVNDAEAVPQRDSGRSLLFDAPANDSGKLEDPLRVSG